MAADRYPAAEWRPLPEATSQPTIRPTQVILHTIVGSAASAYRYFRDSTSLESHFIVTFGGSVWQLMATNRRADANGSANRRPDGTGALSVETEDHGAATVEDTPWTPEQVEAIVELCVWACRTYGIPTRACRNPNDPGIGFHSMFGSGKGLWTEVRGKTCPGRARKEQFPGIVAEVARRVAGGAPAAPAPEPAPVPAPGPKTVWREGDRGEFVRTIQTVVGVTADGIWGPKTTAAVTAFQAKLGVTADGVWGPATQAASDRLFAYLAAVEAAKKPAPAPATDWALIAAIDAKLLAVPYPGLLREGARGEPVTAVQWKASAAGFPTATDGVFGPRTTAQVRAFQRARRLAVDGIVGRQTWNALGLRRA